MGWLARQHPEEMVFGLLEQGFTGVGYDVQPFFSDAHSYVNADNEPVAVSNMDTDGDGPKWYLLDTSRMIRPLVWQVRDDYVFQAQDQPSDDHVFLNTEHGDGGASNPWKGTATPIITPFLNSAAA